MKSFRLFSLIVLTSLSFFATFFTVRSAHAICIVRTEDETFMLRGRTYANSNSLQYILEHRYNALGEDASCATGSLDVDRVWLGADQGIRFGTAEWGYINPVRQIVLDEPLVVDNADQNLFLGNPNLLLPVDSLYNWNYPIGYPGDLLYLDDYGKVILDASGLGASVMPIQCGNGASSEDVVLRSLIIITRLNGIDKEDLFMDTDNLCLWDGGDVHVCDGVVRRDPDGYDDVGWCVHDADRDAVAVEEGDCDDNNESVHPTHCIFEGCVEAAPELCDGLDNDCNGTIDEGQVRTQYFYDDDGDDYGSVTNSDEFCAAPADPKWTLIGGDCNDDNDEIYPNRTEVCNGLDDDCDSDVDEGLALTTYYYDDDEDDYGIASVTDSNCGPPDGPDWALVPGDCNNTDASVNPGVAEVCDEDDTDENCDGASEGADAIGAVSWYLDFDNDGSGDQNALAADVIIQCDQPEDHVDNDFDCNDNVGGINPDAFERCNGFDDNCDGMTDDEDGDFILGQHAWHEDQDGDLYGNPDEFVISCNQPDDTYVFNNEDCDDLPPGGALRNPGLPEVCGDAIDNDCDLLVDGADDDVTTEWYGDVDRDGYGNVADVRTGCDAPLGYVSNPLDCNDARDDINPEEVEICSNGLDDDCSGGDRVSGFWYPDVDSDRFGDIDPTLRIEACDQPAGHVDNNTDCNDDPADDGLAINPDAPETCNTRDDNCNGLFDDEDPTTVGQPTWYLDNDDDGFGHPDTTLVACAPPVGDDAYVTNRDDCSDSLSAINPLATEICDGIDNNCDAVIDFVDADGDTFFSVCESDCEDVVPGIFPGAVEVCGDGIDQDCDGRDLACPTEDTDADRDGYCMDVNGDSACDIGSLPGDCEDEIFMINPGIAEICGDGIDQNCNGEDLECPTDPNDIDNDGDGFTENGGDCDDTRAFIFPGAAEICDGRDNDCDAFVDRGDPDGDGIDSSICPNDCEGEDGTIFPGSDEVCGNGFDEDCDGRDGVCPIEGDKDGDGFTEDGGDCDDTRFFIFPGAAEICDGRDNDCDGFVDRGDPDGDGFDSTICPNDCDGEDDTIFPGSDEVCGNGFDEDCDGQDIVCPEEPIITEPILSCDDPRVSAEPVCAPDVVEPEPEPEPDVTVAVDDTFPGVFAGGGQLKSNVGCSLNPVTAQVSPIQLTLVLFLLFPLGMLAILRRRLTRLPS